MTGLPAKGNMKIDACHPVKVARKDRTRMRRYCLTFCLILLLGSLKGWAQYTLHIIPVDKDSAFIRKHLGLLTSFKSREACSEYVYTILPTLTTRG